MIFRSVFGVIPVPVFYTDKLRENRAGEARGPFIRIRTGYEQDEGLHRHELAHVEVSWATFGLIAFASMVFKKARIWNEARAYKRQTFYPDADGHYLSITGAAARLAGAHYGFGLTQDEAKQWILKA